MKIFVDKRKILIFNNLCIIHDNFEKRMQDVSNFTTRDHLIDWLFSYDKAMIFSETGGCLQDFNKFCRDLLFAIE